jgi:heat shock protein HslJ
MRSAVLLALAAAPLLAQGGASSLAGSAWTATRIGARPAMGPRTPTLRFDEGRVQAHDGCNTLRAPATHSGDAIRVAALAGTMMACPSGLENQARAFRDALTTAARTRVDGDRLVLLSADGKELAEFRRESGALQLTARRAAAGNAGGPQVLPSGPSGRVEPMGGEFTYLADAASFRDCRTGARVPVAMEGAYLDLERAYGESKPGAGAPLYVVLDGAVQPRAKMEGAGTEPTLVVSRHVGTFPSLTCARARGTASLVNTYWRLVRVAGQPVTTVTGRREPHLILRQRGDAVEVSATVGCNGLAGRVTITGDRVEFGPMRATMMACPEPLLSRERALADALRRARAARVVAETMELRDDTGASLALFESVYMR